MFKNKTEALAVGLLVTGVPSVIYGSIKAAMNLDSKNDFSMIRDVEPLSSFDLGALIYGTLAVLALRWIVIPRLNK